MGLIAGIRKLVRLTGFDLIKYNLSSSRDARLVKQLQTNKINVVLDVGANVGAYGDLLFTGGYNGKIISFEPLSKPHKLLQAKAQRFDPRGNRWVVYERCAVGDAPGQIEINVSENAVSSSILPIKQTSLDAAPASRYITKELTQVISLDDVLPKLLQPNDQVFLKLDVQGYEMNVLKGCQKSISTLKGIQLELSFVQLYDGETTFTPMLNYIESLGFSLWGIAPGFTDPNTGRMLQADAFFFRD